MSENLQIADIAELLKTDSEAVRGLFEAGRLHGVRQGDSWSTTIELLEGDLAVLTESARIDRLRAGIIPEPAGRGERYGWITLEWVDDALSRLRED